MLVPLLTIIGMVPDSVAKIWFEQDAVQPEPSIIFSGMKVGNGQLASIKFDELKGEAKVVGRGGN